MNPADDTVWQVAWRMSAAGGGLSFIEAMEAAGVKWSVRTFQANVTRVLGRAALSSAQRLVLTEAAAAAATQAGVVATGIGAALTAFAEWLGITTGALLGWIFVGVVVIGGITYAVYRNTQTGCEELRPQPVQQTIFPFLQIQIPLFGCKNQNPPSSGGAAGGATSTTGSQPAATSCPQQPQVRKKCPWTPEGFEVKECGPGFCYDGGFRGTLACKQENQNVPNARVNDLNNIFCADGFTKPIYDACTGVLLRCER